MAKKLPGFSIGTWAFTFGPFEANPWPLEKVLDYSSDVGFDGIELNGFRPHAHPDDYDTADKCFELRGLIADRGLGVSGYAADFTATPPALCSADDYMQTFRKCLRFCDALTIPSIRVDTVTPPDALEAGEYDERFARLVKTWRLAAEEAQRSGVGLVWEFEPGFWLNKPGEVRRVIQEVGHDNFGALFDTSHAYMGAVIGARQTGEPEKLPGGVAEYAELLRGSISHLHLIDSDGTLHGDETSTHTPFGEGNIDFHEALAPIRDEILALDWWCSDFCFCAETESAARPAPAFMKKLAEEMAQ